MHDVFIPVAEPGIGRRRIARMGVDYGQDPQLPTRGQLVVHKVHAPRPGWNVWRRFGLPEAWL